MVEGDHDAIVQGKNSTKTASIINDLVVQATAPQAVETVVTEAN
jgi:hypothetical protein